jgi:hypothetical protein
METTMARVKAGKVPVSERALLQRINRKLATEDEMIRRARPVSAYVKEGYPNPYPHDLGKYYRIDFNRNFMIETDVDLEALGRKLGALAAWEELKEDE